MYKRQEVFSAPGKVVLRREFVVQIGQHGPFARGAAWLDVPLASRHWKHVVLVEELVRNHSIVRRGRVWRDVLMHVPAFDRDVPVLVELVVQGRRILLEVVVAVSSAVDCVGARCV